MIFFSLVLVLGVYLIQYLEDLGLGNRMYFSVLSTYFIGYENDISLFASYLNVNAASVDG